MSFWDKDNLAKVSSKLKVGWNKASKKTSILADNSSDVASDLQIKAVGDKLKQSSATWLTVYVDEMLDGEGRKDAKGQVKGAETLQAIKSILIAIQPEVSTKISRKKVQAVTQFIDTALTSNIQNVESFEASFGVISNIFKGLDDLSGDVKTQNALKATGNDEALSVLIEGYDYEGRCVSVLNKCSYNKLLDLAIRDEAEVLNISDALQGVIAKAKDLPAQQAVLIAPMMLNDFAQRAGKLYYLGEEDRKSLTKLSSELGSYNLSMSVPSTTSAYTKKYWDQITNSTVGNTGRALGWMANKLK
jgi:hypothetical protein